MMEMNNVSAVVTGGASGLGEATVRRIVTNGGKATILDLQEEKGRELAAELGNDVLYAYTDVTDETSVQDALGEAGEQFGSSNTVVNCAGIGSGEKTYSNSKGTHKLESFSKVIQVNLIGTFNVIRLASEKMSTNAPNEEG